MCKYVIDHFMIYLQAQIHECLLWLVFDKLLWRIQWLESRNYLELVFWMYDCNDWMCLEIYWIV